MSAAKSRPRIQRGRGSLRTSARSDATPRDEPNREQQSLAETLDRVLTRGVVVSGEVVISVAEIPLIYVGVQALVSSVETAARALDPACGDDVSEDCVGHSCERGASNHR